MSPETQSDMFEPFFSTKEMNVGLVRHAVYGIVEQSAGQVTSSANLAKAQWCG